MSQFFLHISDRLFNIKMLFSGQFKLIDPEIEAYKREIYSDEIPGLYDDKINLSSDSKNVAKDYSKAFSDKKEACKSETVVL